MIVRTKVIGWVVLAAAFALWPPLIASSFAYMPQPLASLSAMAHGATFIFVGLLGVYLLMPERRPFDSPLPPLPDWTGDDLFRHARQSGEEGGIVFSRNERGNETKETGGSEGTGRSLPSTTYTTGGTEELKEGKSGERGG